MGREAELAQLQQFLHKALSGERQLAFVTGEAGIGKTTVVEAFLAGLPASQNIWLGQGQCIEQFGPGEAYLPLLSAFGQLGRASGREQVLAVLQQYAPTWLVQMPGLLQAVDIDALQRKTAGVTRERMLREMAEALEALTAAKPLVLVLEDLHWSDPSTLELLSFVARRRQTAHLLVIGAYRTVEVFANGHPLRAVTQELQLHQHCEELPLRLLGEDDIAQYLTISRVVKKQQAAPLPELARLIHQRTEGNPLFMVSVVEDLLTRGVLDEPEIAVSTPLTIQHLIERQFDHLAPAEQEVLAAASVAGVEFSAAAVAAGVEANVAEIETRCADLARREQFLRLSGNDTWPDGTVSGWYGFRHALYQNVLYDRIAEMRRMRLHRLIGERLESGYGEQTTEVAAELAVHFERGRDYRRAVQYREQVAQNALRRHAPQEALRHFTTARELLANLPATPARTRQELRVELALGGLLMTVKGYAALEVKQTYHRAHALGAAVGAPPQEIFHSLWGLFAFHVIRLELDAAYALGEQLCTLATELAAATGAHVALGVVEHHRGNFVRACAHLARGRAVPPSCSAVPDLVRFGQDPWVTGLCYEAFSLALLGYLDQAQRCLQQAGARAQTLADPFTLAFCYEFMCFIAYWRRETHLVARQAEQLLALSTEHDFRMRTAAGHICRGWAFAVQQPSQETITEVGKGIAAWQATGAALNQPFFLAFLGEVALRDQRRKEGSAVIAQALALVQRTGERFYEAELYRLKGELVLQQPGSGLEAGGGREKKAEAEACFWKALEVARLQQAKSLELRAARSLSRLWEGQGEKAAARQLLSEIYGWFTEGFDTKDLQEAKVLIDELSH